MSCCGGNSQDQGPHVGDAVGVNRGECDCEACTCEEALARLCEYLDSECSDMDFGRIKQHFDACAPCFTEYKLTVTVKEALKRACECEEAPEELRATIRASIVQWCDTGSSS